MARIKVLIEGYAEKSGRTWVASSTVCLITTNEGKKIITDPGCHRQKLLEALQKENVTTDDIDYVFLSHCHPDHTMLAGIFERAKYITFDAGCMYDGDHLFPFEKHEMGKDTEIIETPGHVSEHISLLVNTPEGKVAIAGDVIWWLDSEEQIFDIHQIDHSQTKGIDMELLVESRKKLLAMADYIIPGHGKMFQVKK
ncbi:MAG: MBL fold metallo-hydrolase [bacterium]|nr:MBL fold metallo-hydrolase [bacterium]